MTGPEVSFTSGDEALAFVTVRQRSRAEDDPEVRTQRLPMRFTLVRGEDGSWRADRFAIDTD